MQTLVQLVKAMGRVLEEEVLGESIVPVLDDQPTVLGPDESGAWERLIALGKYEGDLRAAVLRAKLEPDKVIGRWLGARLGEAIRAELERSAIDPARCVLVPVPSTIGRLALSGVDHAMVLAQAISRATGAGIVRAVTRRPGVAQHRLKGAAREQGVRGIYEFDHVMQRRAIFESTRQARDARATGGPVAAERNSRAAGMPSGMEMRSGEVPRLVIVIDDIRTTGATARAVCGVVAGAFPTAARWVGVVAVARGEARSRRG